MDGIRIISGKVYLSYSWIVGNSTITMKAIGHWAERNIGNRIYEDNRAYINYDTIPAPSRAKLPPVEAIKSNVSEYNRQREKDFYSNECYKELYRAYSIDFINYRDIYADMDVSPEKKTEYTRKHAVLNRVVEIHSAREFKISHIYNAFTKIYPKAYVYSRMNTVVRKCKEEGIPSVVVHKHATDNAKQYDSRYEEFVLRWMSSGKAYERTTIHDELCKECDLQGWKKPSYGWVKYCVQKHLATVFNTRYGEDTYISKSAPYAGIIKALHVHDQWQMDGWRLPFFMSGYETLNLFAVMDANSGYIIDYDIAKTENTENIVRGLSNAVHSTNCLPFEIVADNHSFNKTKEAEYLKRNAEHLGMTWTVDSNPRRKGIIERRLGVFGHKFLKGYPGYIGQGIKTKNPDGRTSQEEIDKYTKSGMWRTEEEIRIYAQICIDAYNNYKSKKTGKSPKELYEASEQPSKITLRQEDLLRLFIRESEYKVQRGQINITREGVTHEFQLNADLHVKYNGQTVCVRYENFDKIYLFDKETDKYIGIVKRKRMMHGALANQTEEDKRGFLQNAGRIKGIKAGYRGQQTQIISQHPYANEYVNPLVGKKVDIEELAKNSKLVEELSRHGVNMEFVPQPTILNEDNTHSGKSKKEKQAFTVKNNIIKKVEIPRDNELSQDVIKKREQPFMVKNHTIRKWQPGNIEE